jgi:16S rRNA (cytosine1402-N4)-methyltransferase
MNRSGHIPVLAAEVIRLLVTDHDGVFLDGTCGVGGHAELIARELSRHGRLICIDRDVKMLEAARDNLRSAVGRVSFHRCSYDEADQIAGVCANALSGVLLDLGICSAQLDDADRGFSYRFDAPLDMRFDQESGLTAGDYLDSVSSDDLAKALRSYGDFPRPEKLVARIIGRRERSHIRTVGELVSCVEDLFPAKLRNKSIARLLQCIRIAVNDEMSRLDRALPRLVECLKPCGRFAVISYHSQEDRRVKRFFRELSKNSGYPPEIEAGMKGMKGSILRSVTRRAIKASAKEVQSNPRARSARLRVAEKLPFS